MKRRGLVVFACMLACSRRRDPPATSAVPAGHLVAMTHDAFKVDGELDEPDWNRRGAPTNLLTPTGEPARPFSQVRLLHDATTLYIGLYAADQDIRSTDTFELSIGSVALAVTPAGVIRPAIAGARCGHDLDGTLDQAEDEDEEWVLELTLPLAQLGASPLAFRVKRCDTPKDGHVRCGEWAAPIVLGPAD